jgi:thiamine-phosphate pyrophosphorylase
MVDPAPLDYVIAGPVFETASKPGYGPALGPEGLAGIVKASRVPVIAIGGVTLQTISDCLAWPSWAALCAPPIREK